MAFEYKAGSAIWDRAVRHDKCKAAVHAGGRFVHSNQCTRSPWRDGWCKQHHPETEQERAEKRAAKWEAERAARKVAAVAPIDMATKEERARIILLLRGRGHHAAADLIESESSAELVPPTSR